MQNEPPCDADAQDGQSPGMLQGFLQAGKNGRKKVNIQF